MTPYELRRRLLDIGVTPRLSRDGRALLLEGGRARGGCYVLARGIEDAVTQIKAFIEGIE